MSDDSNSDGRRRRRRGRKRGGKKRGGGGGGGGGNNGPGNQKQRSRRKKTPEHKFGGRDPVASDPSWDRPEELNAFELFCTYHLGIFENNQYRDPSIKQVARLFKRSIEEIRDALEACGLDDKSVKETGYDLSLSRLDVKVAPDGIDKRELAKNLFEEFCAEHPGLESDWSEAHEDEDEDDFEEYDDDYEDEEAEEAV